MKICVVGIWIFLTEIRSSSSDEIETHGYTGTNITVSCQHSWASTNTKYFCRDPCKEEDVLVSSDRSPNGRFSLKYLGKGTFTVTITDLLVSDSGIYWCGVDRTFTDTYHKVYLTVSKANSHSVTPTSTELDTTRPLPTPTQQPESPSTTSRKTSRSLTNDDITRSPSETGLLVCIAVGLTVVLVIFGVILYVYKKRKSQSSSGSPADDAKRRTTITTEMAGVYEEIGETQQRTDPHTLTTVHSAVNHHSAANHIQDSSLYYSIQPACSDQTAKSNTDTVIYAANTNKKCVPQAFRSKDTETYDILFCS